MICLERVIAETMAFLNFVIGTTSTLPCVEMVTFGAATVCVVVVPEDAKISSFMTRPCAPVPLT